MIRSAAILPVLGLLLFACAPPTANDADRDPPSMEQVSANSDSAAARALFAGGCFWCMEPPFDRLEGVISTTSGFTGGEEVDPTYAQVSAGETSHIEAVEVRFDPDVVSYAELLEVFWVNIDPFDAGGQFCDRGAHYRAALFPLDSDQQAVAEASLEQIAQRHARPPVTQILPATAFYPAGEEHQGFYQKNPDHYRHYREACGRDRRLDELWGRERTQSAPTSP